MCLSQLLGFERAAAHNELHLALLHYSRAHPSLGSVSQSLGNKLSKLNPAVIESLCWNYKGLTCWRILTPIGLSALLSAKSVNYACGYTLVWSCEGLNGFLLDLSHTHEYACTHARTHQLTHAHTHRCNNKITKYHHTDALQSSYLSDCSIFIVPFMS